MILEKIRLYKGWLLVWTGFLFCYNRREMLEEVLGVIKNLWGAD